MWNFVQRNWTSNAQEGAFLVKASADPTDGSRPTQHIFAFLSRRVGNPHKLVFTECRKDTEISHSGERLSLKDIQNCHLMSYGLAWRLLTLHGPPDESDHSVRRPCCCPTAWMHAGTAHHVVSFAVV